MNVLAAADIFGIDLPKWPQLKLTGKPVTIEQAKDIILRTDPFFTDGYGGNNHDWNDWARHQLGLDLFRKDNEITPIGWHQRTRYRELLKTVDTSYIHNSWASCSFIYGPHGWCSPAGQICYTDNIGKWPSVEEVYKDFVLLLEQFPYVEMTGTLMSGEGCEADSDEGIHPLVTFVVGDGKVLMTDEHEEHHYNVSMPDRSDDAMIDNVRLISFGSNRREQGLPDTWILEFSRITKPLIEEAIREVIA